MRWGWGWGGGSVGFQAAVSAPAAPGGFEDSFENTHGRKCNQCDFVSFWGDNLRTHLKRHSEEKQDEPRENDGVGCGWFPGCCKCCSPGGFEDVPVVMALLLY